MYGVPGTDNKVALKIYHGSQFLFGAVMNYHSDGGAAITNLQLKPAVQLEANTRYEITVERLDCLAVVLWCLADGMGNLWSRLGKLMFTSLPLLLLTLPLLLLTGVKFQSFIFVSSSIWNKYRNSL